MLYILVYLCYIILFDVLYSWILQLESRSELHRAVTVKMKAINWLFLIRLLQLCSFYFETVIVDFHIDDSSTQYETELMFCI